MRQANLRAWAQIASFVLLYAVAIPWYWEAAGLPPEARAGGVPCWFLVAVLGSAVISTAAAWQLRRPWPGEDEPPTSKEARQP